MKQELGNLMAEDPHQEAINLLTYRINSLTTELTAARAKIERIDLSGIHTCHDKCQRWTCVLRRENKMLTEQRDRLAEALRVINTYDPKNGQCDDGYSPVFHARKALQSLTTNANVISQRSDQPSCSALPK